MVFLGLAVIPHEVVAETEPIVIETIDEKITRYASQYGASEARMRVVIKCESNFNPEAVNWNDHHATSKGSHGIAQFAQGTIDGFGKQIGIENPDPYNVDHALEVMAYMFSEGQARHWSCYNMNYPSNGD